MTTEKHKPDALKETLVTASRSRGPDLKAVPLRLSRHHLAFEVPRDIYVLETSEVLTDLRITGYDRLLYTGRAVIRTVVDTGVALVCEANLEDAWLDVDICGTGLDHARLGEEFRTFFGQWEKFYRILPEFKLVTADLQSFLTDMRLWLEQVELGIRAHPSGNRSDLEREIGATLGQAAFPALDALFAKFEAIVAGIPPDLEAVHQNYVRRQLHPLVSAAPFAARSIHKPLGYAGDYEIVNMILRDPHEGGSLFGKVLNRWFIRQPPAEAHRNRVTYLTRKLVEEAVRVTAANRPLRVFNAGCGPAQEIQNFFAEHEVSSRTAFTLLDFNDETIEVGQRVLGEARHRHGRSASMTFVKKSVIQMLKGRAKASSNAGEKYDFVYCAGLFDYLSDAICKQLTNIFFDMVAPGGLLVVTNVDVANPIRHWLGYVLEWHLIYRNADQMRALKPDLAADDDARVIADITGVNVFLEVRKPAT